MITSKNLKDIKSYIYYSDTYHFYLCTAANKLGIQKEFQEYLLNNLDGTTINTESFSKDAARWRGKDKQSRVNWLDKHIKLLEDDNK